MEFEIKQELNEKDYMAYVTHQLLSYFFRPINIAMYVVILGYMIFMLVTTANPVIFLMAGAIILLNIILVVYTRKRAKKFFRENQDLIKMELVFKEEVLVYRNTDGNLEKNWYEFVNVKESEDYIYLAISKQSGLIIVKRQIGSDALAFLYSRLKEHITSKNLKLQNK